MFISSITNYVAGKWQRRLTKSNKNLLYYWRMVLTVVIFTSFLFTSCRPGITADNELSIVLKEAGSNRAQLEKVLRKYSDPKDSLKLKAAIFLIKNLPGLKTLDPGSVKDNNIYFELFSQPAFKDKSEFSTNRISKAIDSLNSLLSINTFDRLPEYKDDLTTINAAYLIENIEKSFYVWRNMPWSRHLLFDEFCEYILPYRCSSTHFDGAKDYFFKRYSWVKDSVKGSQDPFVAANYILNDINTWFKEEFMIFKTYSYLQPISFENLLKGGIGICHDINNVRVMALRSMGIPAAFDFLPNWGNSNASHFWYKIVDKKYDTIKTTLKNQQLPVNTEHIISGTTYNQCPIENGFPNEVKMNYIRTVPKVYRISYSSENNIMKYTSENFIPDIFKQKLTDVTTDYIETGNISLDLQGGSITDSLIFLLCFDNSKWTPVAFSTIEQNKANFNGIGKNIVYITASYKDGDFTFLSSPFHVGDNSQIKYLEPDFSSSENVDLFMKYPYRSVVCVWSNFMVGGQFQFANRSDFSDAVTVHTVTNNSFYRTDIEVSNPNKYRFLIYKISNFLFRSDVGDIQFFEGRGANRRKIDGEKIGNPGLHGNAIQEGMDGNHLTYFAKSEQGESFIGYDLKPGNEKVVTSIRYYPRNDDNAIAIGDEYELFYWNGGWKSLGVKRSTESRKLTFYDVPSNSLLLLKNLKGGNENRIFTYENGQQIFW